MEVEEVTTEEAEIEVVIPVTETITEVAKMEAIMVEEEEEEEEMVVTREIKTMKQATTTSQIKLDHLRPSF